jgi:cytochrome c2
MMLSTLPANPERTIPRQKMGFRLTDQTSRADLMAQLRKVAPP